MAKIISLQKSLALYITTRCNYRCSICLREYGKSTDLDPALLERILPDAISFGYSHIGLTGGEPCMHPEFKHIVETVVRAGVTFNFVSNGSMPERYGFIIDEYRDKLGVVNLSIDGADREVNDRGREKGSFDGVMKAIKYFSGRDVPVALNVTINKFNRHQLEDIIKLADGLGIKEIVFSSVIATPKNRDSVLTDGERISCFRELIKLKAKYKISIYPGSPLVTGKGVDNCVGIYLLSGLMVNPEGELSFCCNIIREGAVAGSLKEESFAGLYKKAMDMSNFLRQIRIDKINAGIKEEGFNSCEFCNKYLAQYIK